MLTINSQDKLVAGFLKECKVGYEVTYIKEDKSKEWPSDVFNITFKSGYREESFEYRAGLGHRIEIKQPFGNPNSLNNKGISSAKFSKLCKELKEVIGSDRVVFSKDHYTKIPKPTQASVLHCLLLDSDCGHMPFRDFCDELGYNYDSISDLQLHRQCEEITKKLRIVFGIVEQEQLRELLQDY